MLGNHADAFFTTPMRTTVVRGGNTASAYRNEMPAPRGGGSATLQVCQMPFGDENDQVTADIADAAGKTTVAVVEAPKKPVNWMLVGALAFGGLVLAGAFTRPR